jgi:hypothetical protein
MQGSGGVRNYFYPTLVGHIHLDKYFFTKLFHQGYYG